MAAINVTNVVVLNNPGAFSKPFSFEITFECTRKLESDLEWKLTYVGSHENSTADQELDTVLVGPVPLGINRFIFEAPAPKFGKLPIENILGVTVCLLSCLYKNKEFIRIGYYVNNEYHDPENEELQEEITKQISDSIDDSENLSDGEENDKKEQEGEEDAEDDDDSENNRDSGNTPEPEATDNKGKEKMKEGENRKRKRDNCDQEDLGPIGLKKTSLPEKFDINKVKRSILYNKPRVTRFVIPWDDANSSKEEVKVDQVKIKENDADPSLSSSSSSSVKPTADNFDTVTEGM